MKRVISALIFSLTLTLFSVAPASAVIFTEDFEAEFPTWESGWLATNSNLQNYYGIGQGRGNNPDGLWIDDGDSLYSGDTVEILFNPTFGSTLSNFAIDVSGHTSTRLQVYDMSNGVLLDTNVTLTSGALTDPGVYSHYSTSSTNGVSKFVFLQTGGGQVEGNTGIDNVTVESGESRDPVVPEPATMALLGSGLFGLLGFKRKNS